MRRGHRWAGVGLALALLAACSAAAPTAVSIGICEPQHLIPVRVVEVCGAQVVAALFSPPTSVDPVTGDVEMLAASSVTSEDARVWRISLRPGRFADGEPVTAQSFADAWTLGAAPDSLTASYFSRIQGAGQDGELAGLRVLDDRTLEVTLAAPFSQLPLLLSFHAFAPMPSSAFEDLDTYGEAPIGNGPYQMDGTWVRGEAIRVRRVDDHPRATGPPAVEFRIHQEAASAYRSVQAGDLDVLVGVPAELSGEARQDFGERLIDPEPAGVVFLGFPLQDPRFADPAVRRAISLAIDRELIVERLLDGAAVPAGAVLPPSVLGARPDACADCEYDPAAARELLDGAGGFQGPLQIWLDIESGNEQVAQAIASQLQEALGIPEVRLEQRLFAEYLEALATGQVDGPYLLAWSMDYPSPENFLSPLFTEGAPANFGGYAEPEVARLLAQGDAAATLEDGLDAYLAAEDQVLADLPVAPLWFPSTRTVHSERVRGLAVERGAVVAIEDLSVDG